MVRCSLLTLLVACSSQSAAPQAAPAAPVAPVPAAPVPADPTEQIRALLREHVPEIAQGTVVIRSIARVPGRRTKVALASTDPAVDPIAVAVGDGGARIRQVVAGIGGEAIDLVPWDPTASRFVSGSVAPVEVRRIQVDEEAHAMVLVVPDDALAVLGQVHLSLAAELTGWTLHAIGASAHEQQGWDAPHAASAASRGTGPAAAAR